MKDIYKTYNFEAFLLDDAFLTTVKSPGFSLSDLEDGDILSGEALEEARRAAAFILAGNVKNHNIDTAALWSKIEKETASIPATKAPAKVIRLHSGIKWAMGIAAAFILIFAATTLVNSVWSPGAEIITAMGETDELTLPDGSIVTLNADSKLAYDKNTFASDRKLNLNGEAYFSVQKGSRFTVVTPQGQVEVLGTTFNVFVRDGIFEVECTSGKVKVTSQSGEVSKILTPGQSIALNLGIESVSTFSERNLWRNKKLEYKAANAADVIKDLERQFGYEIEIKGNKNLEPYSGEIPLQNGDEALKSFTWPLRLNYTIKGEKVEIY
ncbi:MAG: FecR family protein [Saprospiraceae bacterium]|nr:FecR family protein [Saprospiraceae bacterium]